ncbi:S-layer homology domain-containing protein [Tissierella creatinini]|nr:S-layer homology domain-containing protein [Tissierella creatinini]TJX61079.1 S-layer homology domain-containing protein [Soehngenia saccharolytica]
MSKKVLSLVLALVMVLSFSTAFAAAATTPTGNEKVDKLIELGLVKGYADGTYGLPQAITRAEVATMVVRALDLEAVANASAAFTSQFSDMNSANVLWARGYVNVAAGQGIVNGYPNGTFVPAGNITYAEGAAMLVRVLGGLTEAEQATAVWPTTYLAKAAQLGILDGVDGITDFNAAASRENLFEMVFNTLMKGSDILVASTVEGIVVENYRTESLNKDEVVVHVMKDQVARDSKYYEGRDSDVWEAGDEFKVTITAELKEKNVDVETLLGKVVKVSFDKNGKVVGISNLPGYDYFAGELDEVNSKDLRVDGKRYTVGKEEARTAFDERLYQLYINNEDYNYEDFYDYYVDEELEETEEVEYARITVRNGKVLFIDAFAFEDIAPVAKEADSKNKVTFYDDAADGELDTIEIDEDAYVVLFEDNEIKLGDYEDIAVNDVMHWYYNEFEDNDYDELTVFVRPFDDNKVEGEYDEVKATKANVDKEVDIIVDGEEYPAYTTEKESNRGAVYSVDAKEFEFYALSDEYDTELEDFEDEDVVLLRDMFGYVQSISSERVDARFFAVIDDIYNYDFELLKGDNKADWYDSDRKTEFKEDGDKMDGTREQNLAQFDEDDLVLAKADGELLTEMDLQVPAKNGSGKIVKFTKDVIEFEDEFFYIGKNAVVFYVEDDNEAMTVKKFRDNYIEVGAEGYVVVDEDKDGSLALAIVITKATSDKDEDDYEDLVVKVVDVRSTGGKYWIKAKEAASDDILTFYADEDSDFEDALVVATGTDKIEEDDIIEINVPKEADKDGKKFVEEFAQLIDKDDDVFEVIETGRQTGRARGERYIIIEDEDLDRETIWVARDGDVFGTYKAGSFIQITPLDAYLTTEVVNVVDEDDVDDYDMAELDDYYFDDTVIPPTDPVDAVEALITALPTEATVTLANAAAVQTAENAYNALTVAQANEVDNTLEAKLVALVAKIDVLGDVAGVLTAAEDALDDSVAAKAAYLLVSGNTNSDPVYTAVVAAEGVLEAAVAALDTTGTAAEITADLAAITNAIDALADAVEDLAL